MKRFRESMGWKIVEYGLLLWLAWLLSLFLASLAFGSPLPGYSSLAASIGIALLAVALGCVSYLFSRRLDLKDQKEALVYGLSWSAIVLLMTLLITIPNGTTDIIFGNWSTYLLYVGIAVGPLFNFLGKRA